MDQLFAAESLALGAEVHGKDILPPFSGDLWPEMVEALRRVAAEFKTGCLTTNLPARSINGSKSGRPLFVAEVMALFDHVGRSARINLRKPDPRTYLIDGALTIDPKDWVYLDDLGVNPKPARVLGRTTIKVPNAAQALARLKAATKLSLR